jgi:FkbM family methyltransferase
MKPPFVLRRMIEYCSRHVCFTRRLPARFGSLRLRLSPGASLIYYLGLNRPNFNDLYDFAEHYVQPGQTVWDVGGNMGVFSFAAAARARTSGRVLCLEPDLWSVRLLKRSCAYNRGLAAPVDVVPVAASDNLALEWFNIPERSRAASHLALAGGAGEEITGAVREQHLVPTVTLDWLAGYYPPPQVIKIDVDSCEYRVLTGGRALLEQHHPIIFTEVYERNADAVSAYLHALGYTLYDFTRGEAGKKIIARASYNTLALPPVSPDPTRSE